MRHTLILVFLVALANGCRADDEASVLDHPRIVAVRADPPALAPEQSAAIEVLIGGGSDGVLVVSPDDVSTDFGQEFLTQTDSGWRINAPSAAALAEARALLELPEDALLPVALDVLTTVDGLEKRAQKTVFLGRAADNPVLAPIRAAGAEVPATGVSAAVGVDTEFEAVASGGTGALTYSWHSSVGPMSFYRRDSAVLHPEESRQGQVAVVVRDEAGGASWSVLSVVAE